MVEWSRLWNLCHIFAQTKVQNHFGETQREGHFNMRSEPASPKYEVQKREVSSFGRNANGKIENHLPMSWTLLNAILSSALRQKSRVLRNKPFIRNAIVSKSNNNPLVILMFVLVTVLKTRTRHSIDSLTGILLIAHETITIIYLGSFSTPDFPPN